MKKLTKLLCAGLLSFGLVFSVNLASANKQVQEVQATGESENPAPTIDQLIVGGATPNVTPGVTYDDGVLTITNDFSGTQLIVRVDTGGPKADLTVVIRKGVDGFIYNKFGNLTIDSVTLNAKQIVTSGNLTFKGNSIIILNPTENLPDYNYHSVIYVGEKLIINDNVTVSGGLPVELAYSLISTKYLEVNTNNGININCNSNKPEFGGYSRYATICFHDCPKVDALAGRLTLKHGQFILEKYYSEEDTQYNDKFGFVAWDNNNGLNVFGSDHFDLENKLFTGYPIECTNSELKIKTRNIDFDENGGTGDSLRYSWYPIGSTITLPECPYTAPEGQHFVGWALGSKTASSLKQPGETFVLEEGDDPSSWKYDYYTVYAIWADDTAELTGTVSITGSLKYDETLTASVTDSNNTGTLSYQWRRNGDDIAGATNNTYLVTENDIGYTLSVVVSSSVESGSLVATASGVIAKADGPAAPTGISVIACTSEANDDGVINGVTTEMEYKLSSDSVWTPITGTSLTGLLAGTYNIRYQETNTHEAGETANVVVNAYNAPVQYSVTVNGGTANPVSATEGTTITITANAPEEGKVFSGWTSDDGVAFADASALTTTFVMPTKNVTVTANYEDEVIPTVLQSITLSGTHKTSFEVGDTFSYEGLIVTAHYNNKADTIIANGYNVSSPDMSTEGSKTVTVSYTEEGVTKTATYQITVTAKETPVTPSKNSGLPAGAIVGIVIGSVLAAGIGGFALVWFVIKKKTWADFIAIFKKK